MNNYLFLFRADWQSRGEASPEEMQASMKRWMDWIGGIGAQGKLVDRGSSLAGDGKVARANQVITDGPYTELKEVIGGYTIVKAETLEEATAMAEGCPAFEMGGSVEVRPINVM